jgi:hypothetical protein
MSLLGNSNNFSAFVIYVTLVPVAPAYFPLALSFDLLVYRDVYPFIKFRMTEPYFMKLGMYTTEPERILTADKSFPSVCLYV